MKFFLVISAFCVAVTVAVPTPNQIKGLFDPFQNKCIAESGAELAEINAAKMGNFPNPSRGLKCFSQCILRENKMVNNSGNLQLLGLYETGMRINLSASQLLSVVTNCPLTSDGKDVCEISMARITCFYNYL